MDQSPITTPSIRRARIACKACHARRVKCDAADGIPCWHCRTRQTACELIESRRGRWTRQTSAKPRDKPSHRRSAPATNNIHRTSELATGSGNIPDHDGGESSPTAVVHVRENNGRTPAQNRQALLSSEAEPVGPQAGIDGQSPPLGNSLTLSYIVRMARHAKDRELGHLHANNTDHPSLSLPLKSDLGDPVSLQDALVVPERRVSDQLVRSFFKHFHPAYPVIDRLSFTTLYKQGRASPLLLHAIYMVALTCGPESLVQLAGYSDRTEARKAHYVRVKVLYDADNETDETILAGALHLLSFWWLGPNDQKDSWYWQGCAVTLAQSLGMHRSLARRAMSPRKRSIWKRIWWSIYIRDRHVAAALGRPCRIRDEDCDNEPPDKNDLMVDLGFDDELVPAQEAHHISYFMEITRLSTILGDVIIGEFSPCRPALEKYETTSCLHRLQNWHSCLPRRTCDDLVGDSADASFWAAMLDISYQCACILIFRPKGTASQPFPDAERDRRALRAADAITRAAEDFLAAGIMHYSQLHFVPALFSALSIYSLSTSQKNAIQRQLAENKSRQCILALTELAKIWPVNMWVVKSFSNLLQRLLGQHSTSLKSCQSMTSRHDDGIGVHASSAVQLSSPLLESQLPPPGSILGIPDMTGECLLGDQTSGGATADFFQANAYPNYFMGAADQFVYDSAWLGYLEGNLDMEFLQREFGKSSES